MLRLTNHKCEENSNCYVADIMFCDDCTGLGILVLKAKLDITLEDLQKGPVFLSLAYKGTFFWLAVPGTQNLPGRWGLKTTHYLPLLSLLVTVSKHLLFIITYTQVKNKSNWLYCYNYSQQDILALCTRPENFVLLPIDCVWNEGFWILQTPVPRSMIFWWGNAETLQSKVATGPYLFACWKLELKKY